MFFFSGACDEVSAEDGGGVWTGLVVGMEKHVGEAAWKGMRMLGNWPFGDMRSFSTVGHDNGVFVSASVRIFRNAQLTLFCPCLTKCYMNLQRISRNSCRTCLFMFANHTVLRHMHHFYKDERPCTKTIPLHAQHYIPPLLQACCCSVCMYFMEDAEACHVMAYCIHITQYLN